jgi:hypothetical protein
MPFAKQKGLIPMNSSNISNGSIAAARLCSKSQPQRCVSMLTGKWSRAEMQVLPQG